MNNKLTEKQQNLYSLLPENIEFSRYYQKIFSVYNCERVLDQLCKKGYLKFSGRFYRGAKIYTKILK